VDRRTASGFGTDQEYLDALLEADEREALRQAIDRHKESLLRVESEIEKNSKHIGNKERPDIPRLEELEGEAEKARIELRDRWNSAEGEKEKLKTLSSDLATIAEKSGDLEKRYGIVGRLSDVANGRSMTFQRYVLAALLDDVLLAASERLQLMSRGRYRLMRRMVQADKRSHAGLDLDVEDTYTGKARPVSTLSGGESFQAALSLAMGLAEVVQSYAGGIRLDTIFVDEGFGSLDPEALDSAVNALVDLQQAGRMVGVISHVPELKERIDVRLEVQGSRSGSTAGFVVP
jgi:exonuclease SbcC